MLIIKELEQNEYIMASDMIAQVFNKFVAPDYSLLGVQNFYEFITPEAFAKRLLKNSIILVACFADKIIGLVEINDYSHISLLFVSVNWQNHGISKKLLAKAIEKANLRLKNARLFNQVKHENLPEQISHLSVNSSLYAVGIYKKLGFTVKSTEQTVDGIRFVAMSKDL